MIQRVLVGHFDPLHTAVDLEPRIDRPLDRSAVAAIFAEHGDPQPKHPPTMGGGLQWLGRIAGEHVWYRDAGDLGCPYRNETQFNFRAMHFIFVLRQQLDADVFLPRYGLFQERPLLDRKSLRLPEPSVFDARRNVTGTQCLVWIAPRGRRMRHFVDCRVGSAGLELRTRCGVATFLQATAFRIVDSAVEYIENTPLRTFCRKCRTSQPLRGTDLAAWVERFHPVRTPVLESLREELLSSTDPTGACLAFSDWFEERGDAIGTALFRIRGGSICGADLRLLFEWPPERWEAGMPSVEASLVDEDES